jgi:hypothetical protein
MESQTLQYESTSDDVGAAIRRRPWWVYAVVGVYALLVLGVVGLATAVPVLGGNDGEARIVVVTVAVLVLCGASLIAVPVRAAKRRPMTRRALWVPIVASAVLAGGLVFGAALALAEYARAESAWPTLVAAGAVWAGWAVVFGLLSLRRGPQHVLNVLHRWLLAGSVLELLVAVPTHVIVRRRDECCAGVGTAIGICLGIAVMLAAFGPSVALLYYRRWKQITPPRSPGI